METPPVPPAPPKPHGHAFMKFSAKNGINVLIEIPDPEHPPERGLIIAALRAATDSVLRRPVL